MPTKNTKAYEQLAINDYVKTIPDIDVAAIEYPDPPDCIIKLKNNTAIWVEVSSVYRHTELAKNLNSGILGKIYSDFLGTVDEFHDHLISCIISTILKKDSKTNYKNFTSKYGTGVLILYFDDPLLSVKDLEFVVKYKNYSEMNLVNFHSVYLYVRPEYSTYGGNVFFIDGTHKIYPKNNTSPLSQPILITKLILLIKAIIIIKQLDAQVDVLWQEISKLYEHIFAIQEIIFQSHSKFNIYKQYNLFFYSHYLLSYNEVILGIGRLIDRDKNAPSIINLLKEGIEKNDELSKEEAVIYKKIMESHMHQKIKNLRNKFGIAHLDKEISVDPKKQLHFYEKNKFELKELIKYIDLLKEGAEIISFRSSQPTWLLHPHPTIKKEIRDIFEKLDK